MDNCVSCVSTEIANRFEVFRKPVTAEDIERMIAATNAGRAIQLHEALRIIEEATGLVPRKQPFLAEGAPVGYYSTFKFFVTY